MLPFALVAMPAEPSNIEFALFIMHLNAIMPENTLKITAFMEPLPEPAFGHLFSVTFM